MNFQTHNQKEIEISGTSLIGEINVSYEKLKNTFGEPDEGDGYKTDAEWNIEFENGVIATIYNYKDGKNYMGEEGTPTTEILDWHIGGFRNTNALELLKTALENKGEWSFIDSELRYKDIDFHDFDNDLLIEYWDEETRIQADMGIQWHYVNNESIPELYAFDDCWLALYQCGQSFLRILAENNGKNLSKEQMKNELLKIGFVDKTFEND